MSRGKAMVISHTVVFLFGAACMKMYDRDELNSYRGAYEKPMQKFRRYAGNLAIGTITLGSLVVAFKMSGAGGKGTASGDGSGGSIDAKNESK